jgi:hypothetical protein
MGAIATDQLIYARGTPIERRFTATAAIIYAGDLVGVDDDGLAAAAADAAATTFIAGVAAAYCAASGTVRVLSNADFKLLKGTAAVTDINSVVYTDDSGGVTASAPTYKNVAGVAVGFESTTHLWVHINHAYNVYIAGLLALT